MHSCKTKKWDALCIGVLVVLFIGSTSLPGRSADTAEQAGDPNRKVMHRTVKVDGLDIFYREAGPKDAPTILLPHGFPTSSHMFRNLMPALADQFHLVARTTLGMAIAQCRQWTSSTTPSIAWRR